MEQKTTITNPSLEEKPRFRFQKFITERKIDTYIGNLMSKHANNKCDGINKDIRISIQASEFHYCSPRETFDELSMYDEFEIAIFYKDRPLIVLNDLMKIGHYEMSSEIENVMPEQENGIYIANKHLDGEEFERCLVAGYLSGEIIDSIVDDLISLVIKFKTRLVLFEKFKQQKYFPYLTKL